MNIFSAIEVAGIKMNPLERSLYLRRRQGIAARFNRVIMRRGEQLARRRSAFKTFMRSVEQVRDNRDAWE